MTWRVNRSLESYPSLPTLKAFISPVSSIYCVPILCAQVDSKIVLSPGCYQLLITEPAEAC